MSTSSLFFSARAVAGVVLVGGMLVIRLAGGVPSDAAAQVTGLRSVDSTQISSGAAHSAASGPVVKIWMTTTSDPRGRVVVKGLHREANVRFAAAGKSSLPTITVNESAKFQRFTGGGASLTDSAAWLLHSYLSSAASQSVMKKLFSPSKGIRLSFLRNPLGASDLTRYVYSYDDTCCDLSDFSIAHDLADIVPLTKQARVLNPKLTLMMNPWSPPGWMKTNGQMIDLGELKPEYYDTLAQYFVKTIQAYAAQGIAINYVSIQNEPTCCGTHMDYPSLNWNAAGMDSFIKNNLYPAFRAAGIKTKVLVLDFNWDTYSWLGEPLLADPVVRTDPLFGGIAWHGYDQPAQYYVQSQAHASYPSVQQFETEHSGGTWIANQKKQDFEDIIGLMRNWGQSFVKWSLAVDENYSPHTGGCGACTGLVTVHRDQPGRVDYTIEYYTMGHLTKFVIPGAYRIASTDSSNHGVLNVAFKNPDGSKVLIAYNQASKAQRFTVRWKKKSFTYRLPVGAGITALWK